MSEEKESIITKGMNFIKEQGKIAEEKTGIPSKYLFTILAICILSVFIGFLDVYITALVGIVIPSIGSMRSIESKEIEDDKLWLTYWIVYGIFSFIDLFTSFLLKYIPFYFILKIVFLIWLFMPNTRGAIIIYDKLISKFFKKYEKQIDDVDNQFQSNANNLIGKVEENIPDKNKMKDIQNMGNLANNFNSNKLNTQDHNTNSALNSKI